MIDTSAFQGKTASYYTLGCKLNFSETSTFGQMLQELGVRTVDRGERADICLINTCSVTAARTVLRIPWCIGQAMKEKNRRLSRCCMNIK